MYVTDPKFALTNAELSPQAQNNNNIFNSPPRTQFGSPQINSPMFNSPMGNQSLFNFTTTPSPQTSRPAQFSIHDLQQRMQQQQEDELYRELQPLEIDPSEIRLVQPIGEGYFGAVYKGIYRDQIVAVKKIVRHQFRNMSDMQMFIKEITIWSKLTHPCVVSLRGVSMRSGPERLMITEYMGAGSLKDVIQNPTYANVLAHNVNNIKYKIARLIAEGMNYLHSYKPLPIIHRDLSSPNIFLDENLNAKIGDFGLSRFVSENGKMTVAVGSCVYMAPEVYRGENYNEKADVYSFGVICWEMWSLSDPTQNTPAEMYASEVAIHNKRPPFDVVFNKRTQSMIQFQVPEKWKYLIENCWAADPARRPSFEQIIQFLDTHLKG
jgi:serine/threonine protein kinase